MLYDFKCANCGNEETHKFAASDYKKYVKDDNKLKRRRCKECNTISLYRHIKGMLDRVGPEDGESIIVIYFKCDDCDHVQQLDIKTDKAFYQIEDQYIDEDKRAKNEKCKGCGSDEIFYHNPGKAPAVLGGTSGYMSMERWMKNNPEHAQRKEAEMMRTLEARKEKRNKKINQSGAGGRAGDRHKGYGRGQQEQKLKGED